MKYKKCNFTKLEIIKIYKFRLFVMYILNFGKPSLNLN
jgi:hypothetical protein